ncbi:major facilitator superfamily domain-containing protein [Phialemonium atrogriseum]|uniref:Major facilitator superfamily domain-containing protein n=1 Tax=Phialemonium atrogriseum TaxID=1093897 RepID=A0AAJ0BZY5_9PEZI|nr:major facilitator superfamily domain-containing protein [Phialemonium atrogriseum]KAK1765156.1 major facilitator superfamily domain-containing protein [Phialemonium atrogriseum]
MTDKDSSPDGVEGSVVAVGITSINDGAFHYVARGGAIDELSSSDSIDGFDSERMRDRTLLTAEEEKKLLRRIDWHLMPLCSLIFMFKNLDSQNISNARIMNQGSDQNIMTQLGMTSDQYALLTAVYYIPYIVAEAPSNLLLKRYLPSRWQSRIMITWGVMLMCHAAVKNKEGLYATRFLLGLAEAGQFPGVILQMCYWYRPDEMSLRLLYFYACGNVAGIVGGLLAFAFDHASGSGGLSGWQWLFLVEGIVTVVVGVAIWFLLPDFPDTAKWLTDREKAFIQARLPSNAPRTKEQNFKWAEIVESLQDKRLWLFTAIWAIYTVGTSGVTFYQSTVIVNLGFTNIATAQILNIPITVTSLLVIGITGVIADRGRFPRPVYPLTFLIIIIACYGVLVAYPNTGGVYAATLIGNAVTAAWYPMMWPWRVQTTSRATGSAFSIGFVNSYGQIGGAVGPQIFRSKYAPHYTVPFTVAMCLVAACMVVTLLTWWVTWDTERDTRRLKLARKAAEQRGETILEDVVDNDLQKRPKRGGIA